MRNTSRYRHAGTARNIDFADRGFVDDVSAMQRSKRGAHLRGDDGIQAFAYEHIRK
jgi:NADPH-dependent curcumin reductase CurA